MASLIRLFVSNGFRSQRVSNAESVYMTWRWHGLMPKRFICCWLYRYIYSKTCDNTPRVSPWDIGDFRIDIDSIRYRSKSGFPSQRNSGADLWKFLAVCLDKLLNKQSSFRWFEKPWRACDFTVMLHWYNTIGSLQSSWRSHKDETYGYLTFVSVSPAWHYSDVIMGTIASQITSLTTVYSTVYSDGDQRKHQSSASLAFVRGIHRGPVKSPVNSPHKWPVTRKMFPFDDVIMINRYGTSISVPAMPHRTAYPASSDETNCSNSNVPHIY